MSSAQLRLMSDLKSIRQEPPEVPNFFFFLPLHCPASLVGSLFLWSYICCCCLTWLGFFFPCGISFHGNPFWVPCWLMEEEVLGWLVGFSFLGLFFWGGCFPFLGFLKHVPQWYVCGVFWGTQREEELWFEYLCWTEFVEGCLLGSLVF